MAERRFAAKMAFMLGGLLIWAAHFTVVYIFNTLACTRRFAGTELLGLGIVPLTVVAATLLALAAVAWLLRRALAWRGDHVDATSGFLRDTTATIAVLSLVAIALSGLPALVVPPCG